MNRYKNNVSKKERKLFIETEKFKITKLSERFNRHVMRNKNLTHINRKIFYLLHDPFTIINAYAKISKNKGALTEVYGDEKKMKYFGMKQAKTITEKLKKGTYKFKSLKRTWIPKPEKKIKRPLGVPTQSDGVVQEAIRGILEAIYEPVFKDWEKKNLSSNYGLRSNRSRWLAIDTLKRKSKRCTIAIKGDIVSAYNNVNHKILINILREKIMDKKFLRLISNMLKSGIIDSNRYECSLNGTPQEGTVSPLLFNIYMFSFDQFIYNEFIASALKGKGRRKVEITSKAYASARHRGNKKLKNIKSNQTELKKALKSFKQKRKILLSKSYMNVKRLEKGAVFVRYADDWVLALNCNKRKAEKIKDKISEFLLTHKKIKLDEDKIKITFISEGYKFLGFSIRLNVKKPKIRFVTQETAKNKFSRHLKRTISRQLTIESDSEEILQRLKATNFCNNDYKPRGKSAWLIYNEFRIVQKFSQVFRGIYNYYSHCGRLTGLYHISYILQYSCARTLARKKNVSLKKIFTLYGKNMQIKTKDTTKTRSIEFKTLKELMRFNPVLKEAPNEQDF